MKEIRRQIIVTKKEADEINALLKTEPKDESDCFGKNTIKSYTAEFDDGIEMDVKICGVQYEENGNNTPWTEAVLFMNGHELCCTEVGEDFLGEWELEYDGTKYITEVITEPEIHNIWHNDAYEIYEALKKEEPDEREDDLWDDARDQIDQWFEDEQANLNVEASGQLILIGTLEVWNGPRPAYKKLTSSNIGGVLPEICGSFQGDNIIRIYEQGGSVYVTQTGHDNPTNPSVFELRALTTDFDDLEDDKPETLKSNSQPVGDIVSKVYGWI